MPGIRNCHVHDTRKDADATEAEERVEQLELDEPAVTAGVEVDLAGPDPPEAPAWYAPHLVDDAGRDGVESRGQRRGAGSAAARTCTERPASSGATSRARIVIVAARVSAIE